MKAFCVDIKFHSSVCNCFVQSFLSGEEVICLVHFSDQFLIKTLHATKTVVAVDRVEDHLAFAAVQHAIEKHLNEMPVAYLRHA